MGTFRPGPGQKAPLGIKPIAAATDPRTPQQRCAAIDTRPQQRHAAITRRSTAATVVASTLNIMVTQP